MGGVPLLNCLWACRLVTKIDRAGPEVRFFRQNPTSGASIIRIRAPISKQKPSLDVTADQARTNFILETSGWPCADGALAKFIHNRSEERRVGKECRSRWS